MLIKLGAKKMAAGKSSGLNLIKEKCKERAKRSMGCLKSIVATTLEILKKEKLKE